MPGQLPSANVRFPPIADIRISCELALLSRVSTALASAALVALAACMRVPPAGSEVSRWPSVTLVKNPPLPNVTVSLPPGFSVSGSGHGTDSTVARIVGPGLIINADYGRAGMQTCGNLPGCREVTATVDGRPASWVRFPQQGTALNHSFSERLDFAVKLWPSQDPRLGPTAGLMLSAFCAAAVQCDLAEHIARSVKFSEPPR